MNLCQGNVREMSGNFVFSLLYEPCYKIDLDFWECLEGEPFFTYETEFVLSGAGKFCLAHGLRQLTREFKVTSELLNFRNDITYASLQNTPTGFQRLSKIKEITKEK